MTRTSTLPGFHKLPLEQRRAVIAEVTGTEAIALARAVEAGGMTPELAACCVENVLGTYALPYGVVVNALVNGRDRLVPMVVEEPSVVAAASNGAKMVRAGGGFQVELDPPHMIAQIQITDVANRRAAIRRILDQTDELLARANAAVPGLVRRGGGARKLELRKLGTVRDRMIVAHVVVDCCDAMGANLLNTIAEAIGPRVAELAKGRLGLRILSNLSDTRCVRVTCALPLTAVATPELDGRLVADGIVNASRFAELDPYRAATHNKGIMNGIDPVVIATGNDWRAIEAGAHAFAARNGQYGPLSTWHRDGDRLLGRLELPMALGVVGGTLRVHPAARLSLELLGRPSAMELAGIAAAVGLASNLAALRALATDGIQRGHMALHARTVATAAGAIGEEVARVAAHIVASGDISVIAARAALAQTTERQAVTGRAP